jgi:hypothetical protein
MEPSFSIKKEGEWGLPFPGVTSETVVRREEPDLPLLVCSLVWGFA